MTQDERADPQSVASAGDLVEQRQKARWNLALVQREEVWDELRMRHLVDSLLAGYPIGAILLSRVAQGSIELAYASGGRERAPRDAAADSWQILDGQQRINALYSVFTDDARYGHFFLNMVRERPEPSASQSSRQKKSSLPHLSHAVVDEAGGFDEPDDRVQLINLSRWEKWARENLPLNDTAVTASSIGRLLHSVDPEFTPELSEPEALTAATNFRRLIRAWTDPVVPILRVELESPLDVLEVFTRINLGGVAVASADVYFAGIKTFWPGAESRIDELLSDIPVLRSRIDALRFLSRLASRGVGHGDAIPLSVDRLAGPRGELLRAAMEEIASPGSVVRSRLSWFTAEYVKRSALGYGLHTVTRELWDEVLGWAATSSRSDEEWLEANIPLIDGYLLGATIFKYRSIMRDTFRRIAFTEALEAGHNGADFPVDEILAVTRARTELRGGRGRVVLGLETQDERAAVANGSGRLLTTIAQEIPYAESGFDWDHIFPGAQANRMWTRGERRRRHHRDRHFVNTAGNLWALPASANRALQDKVGQVKFDLLEEWMRESDGTRVWSRDRWSISPEEVERFVEVDRRLTDSPRSIDRAMRVFRTLVETRTHRLLDEALERFPTAAKFALDPNAAKADSSATRHDYREALGLKAGDPEMKLFTQSEAAARLRERTRRLETPIVDQLQRQEKFLSSRLWHQRKGAASHVVIELVGGNVIELMFRWSAGKGARVEAKAYPDSRHTVGDALYDDFRDYPLDVTWSASDRAIIDCFLAEVERLETTHPR